MTATEQAEITLMAIEDAREGVTESTQHYAGFPGPIDEAAYIAEVSRLSGGTMTAERLYLLPGGTPVAPQETVFLITVAATEPPAP